MPTDPPDQTSTTPSTPPSIDTLLQLLPNHPHQPSITPSILNALHTHPALALTADPHGYTLAHASASYGAHPILRALSDHLNAQTILNKPDNDGDTPLFYAETLDSARLLVELGAEWRALARNEEGLDAEGNARVNAEEAGSVEEGKGWGDVAAYLAELKRGENADGDATHTADPSDGTSTTSNEPLTHPPPLPPGITMNLNTPAAEPHNDSNAELDESSLPPPDPEFRRRIEALAAREGGLETEAGQRELRELVEDAVGGLGGLDADGGGGGKRRAG